MIDISPDGAKQLKLSFRINRLQSITFLFTENGLDFPVGSPKTWQFFVKKYAGGKKNVISLTINNGITIPIYEDNQLLCTFTAAQTNIEEGEYYWELLRTDTMQTLLNGNCTFTFGPQDSNVYTS